MLRGFALLMGLRECLAHNSFALYPLCTGGRQSFAFAIIHALPLPPRHKDTKYTAFSATDCTDFHRFSSMLSDVSVKIRGKNKTRQCPGRNIQPGCSLCLRVFVVHLRELPCKNMTDTQKFRSSTCIFSITWGTPPGPQFWGSTFPPKLGGVGGRDILLTPNY